MNYEIARIIRDITSKIKNAEIPEQTIPVQIDSVMQLEGFQRTRCIYFLLEVIDGSIVGPYTSSFNDRALLAMWGNWSVLTGPGRAISMDGLFTSPEMINQTLTRIEETNELILELSHIWLPNSLLRFEEREKEIRKGDVYRLSFRLFYECYRFIAGMISEKEWLEKCDAYSTEIEPSNIETTAFRKWRLEEIQRSRDHYHSENYSEYRLPKKRMKK
jgi:hypothetical protein